MYMGSLKKCISKLLSVGLVLIMVFMIVGCGKSDNSEPQQESTQASKEETTESTLNTNVKVRVGSLKGPTSIGLVSLMNEAKQGSTKVKYDDFKVVANADELTTQLIQGNLDIALVPANVASILYNKTNGDVRVLDINTLGVLYMVTGSNDISTIEDLKGKTIYLTGKGTTPDYVLQYLLEKNSVSQDEVTLEYKSESTEVAAVLSENPDAVGLLPQPFVTVACAQNDKLQVVIDMTKEWKNVQGESGGNLVTGVTVARREFVEKNPDIVKEFIKEHKKSTEFTESDLDKTADYVVELGIVAKKELAKKAIPQCNIVCITGEQMKKDLSGYLNVLFDKNASSVGGALPKEDFYYTE